MLPVARSFSGGTAIHYVLLVGWMSYFHMMDPMVHNAYSYVVRGLHNSQTTASIPARLYSTIKASKCLSWVAHQWKSLLSMTVLLFQQFPFGFTPGLSGSLKQKCLKTIRAGLHYRPKVLHVTQTTVSTYLKESHKVVPTKKYLL